MSPASSRGRQAAVQRRLAGSRCALAQVTVATLLLYKGIDFPHADVLSVDPHS